MEAFYLANAALFTSLVQNFDPFAAQIHFSRQQPHPSSSGNSSAVVKPPTTSSNSNMVIAARIRPMREEDEDEGRKFPCAVFARRQKDDDEDEERGGEGGGVKRESWGGGGEVVDVHDLYHRPIGKPVLKSSAHRVDRVYSPLATSSEIYTELVAEVIPLATAGGVGTLFAYGQTGSGKTFTITALQRLAGAAVLDAAQQANKHVYLTVVDLAGNAAHDLLEARKSVAVRQDAQGTTQLAGVGEHRIDDVEQLLALLEQAAAFRHTAATLKNDASSRSHCICRMSIRENAEPPRRAKTSSGEGYLYLVDLAGSEAARDVAQHGADRMRETREINMSLSVLKDCIRGKAEMDGERRRGREGGKKVHLPIRQSALTRVLKHVFDPDQDRISRTVVIACVNPSLPDVGSSRNTLRYAELLRGGGAGG